MSYVSGFSLKILCSPNHEAFQWTAIQAEKLPEYLNRNLVPGGSEVGSHLYIGRIFRENSVYVGKYFGNRKDVKHLAYPYGDKPVITSVYQILYYDCSKVCNCKKQQCNSLFPK